MPPTASRALSHRIVFAWFSALIFSAALLPLPAHAASTLLKPPNNLGLVGYWSFDDGTSTQATDFSGNGNTGTLTTTGSTLPAWTSGKKGNALSFDGSSSYVTAGKISGLAGATKATISAWLYRASPNDPVALGQTDTGGSTTRFGVQWSSDNNSYCAAEAGSGLGYSVAASGPIIGWHYFVGVFDGSLTGNARCQLYIDGVFQTMIDGGNGQPASALVASGSQPPFDIGRFNNTPPESYSKGKIDDVRIYNRALGASEVARLYLSGAVKLSASSASLTTGTTLGAANGLVGLWTFDGKDTNWRTGQEVDESGQGNTGTLVGLTQQSTTAGHLGQALTFDGSSSYVVTPTAVLTTTPLTFSAWIYPMNTNADKFVVGVGSATGGSLNEIYMEASNSGQISVWQWANGSFSGNSGPSYAANVWQHVAGVVDASGNITIYSNGVPTSAGTISGSPSGLNKTAIGAFIHNDGSFSTNFAEKLDDVRIYNRALTATEVQHLYKLGSVTVRQN